MCDTSLGDSWASLVAKRRIETALHLLTDPRLSIDQIAELLGLSERRFRHIFTERTGTVPSAVQKTLHKTANLEAAQFWLRAEGGKLSAMEARTVAGYLRGLHAEEPSPNEQAVLALRKDIVVERVRQVIDFEDAIPKDSRVGADLVSMLQTHSDFSAATWYLHWIRDRLESKSLRAAWAEWQTANRALARLLQVPKDQRIESVRKELDYQSTAFLWLLVDCLNCKLFDNFTDSEHYVELTHAASKARLRSNPSPVSMSLYGLALSLKANILRRRSLLSLAEATFEEAFDVLNSTAEVQPWIPGLWHSLYSSLLNDLGRARQARRALLLAAPFLKKSKDHLERVRVAIKQASTRFFEGKDPSRLLDRCIQVLRHYPFASDLIQVAHMTRLAARLFLADRLTGRHLSELRRLRRDLPPANSAFMQCSRRQIDGLLAFLSGEADAGAELLHEAAQWYEERDLLADAAVCWTQYSLAVLELDPESARKAALVAHDFMRRTGFASYQQQELAQKLYLEAKHRTLSHESLRWTILVRACPKYPDPAGARTDRVVAILSVRIEKRLKPSSNSGLGIHRSSPFY